MPAIRAEHTGDSVNLLFQCRLRHCYARNRLVGDAIDGDSQFQCRLRHCYARNIVAILAA